MLSSDFAIALGFLETVWFETSNPTGYSRFSRVLRDFIGSSRCFPVVVVSKGPGSFQIGADSVASYRDTAIAGALFEGKEFGKGSPGYVGDL